mgnify:FL=1|jgi:CheY-like chemotaxis protein
MMAQAAPLRILIIDDDIHVQKSLAFVFRMMGHEIFAADSAAQGVRQFVESRPQLVFVDMVMPGGLGIDAVREIRALDAVVHIVAMSGSDEGGQHNLLALARAAGANRSLGKPFDFDAVERLLAEVATAVAARRRAG